LDLTLPQFSIPGIESIRVNTYVNLEVEADFITELARQIVAPINTITADFTNTLRLKDIIEMPEFDVGRDININLELD
jgi:hypothetical protein